MYTNLYNFNDNIPLADSDAPIIPSLLDTDVYKFLMQQVIWAKYRKVKVTFKVINRHPVPSLASIIPRDALLEQLEHMRSLRFMPDEIDWLRNSSFNGEAGIWDEAFLAWLKSYQLPPYKLDKVNDEYELSFTGSWPEVTLWEIPVLSILSELRSRYILRPLSASQRSQIYKKAFRLIDNKARVLAKLPFLGLADFGTRRRHSLTWQRLCLQRMNEPKLLGRRLTGTSNGFLAKELGLSAIGTNGHEMPMVVAALAQNDEQLKRAPLQALDDWRHFYGGNLRVVLPDTYGTSGFLQNCPDWVADWVGFRPDSKEPIEAGEEIIAWWQKMGKNPKTKRLIFSDNLNATDIEKIYHHFYDKVGLAFGWGTRLTNDFSADKYIENEHLRAASLVCKVSEVDGRPAVKLSDNASKISGEAEEVARYLRVFSA